MSARGLGGATDRNSLSTREAYGATMLVEVDPTAVAKRLLVRFIPKVREVVGSLLVRKEVEQPQELAMIATRGRHARREKRQRPIAVIRLPIGADFVSTDSAAAWSRI